MGFFTQPSQPVPRPDDADDADNRSLDTVVPLVRPDLNREESGPAQESDWVVPKGDPATPVVDFLTGSLIVLYAFDQEHGFHLVAHHDLARLGVDQAALAAAARENLVERVGDLEILERPDGCGMLRLDGHLEASLLLLPQLWHNIAEILGDEVLAAVPARDVVLFCGAGNEAGRSALRAARDRVLAVGDHRITKGLFRFVAGSWQVEPAAPA